MERSKGSPTPLFVITGLFRIIHLDAAVQRTSVCVGTTAGRGT
jgi:hypothetical protein